MEERYQLEIDNFIHRFGQYQNADIVLYGIGRYTATLLEGLQGFHIIGLMDKDPDNIGKIIFGIPVISKETAETIADMVIINTAETYWNVIYNRIYDMKIPVYYINGEKAEDREPDRGESLFEALSYSDLLLKIENAEVVSFDFFDTLFARSVCNPRDVFQLMETQTEFSFTQMRDNAKKYIRTNYTLDELYLQIEIQSNISHQQMEEIKSKELELEKKILFPREKILLILKELLKQDKEVYIVSDMYLPKLFYIDVLKKFGIFVTYEAVLLSNDLDANKVEGSIWKYFSEEIVKGRHALHIGDNKIGDIDKPMEYNIETYLTPCAWDMFLNSSLKDIAPHICSLYGTMVMGCILNRLFGNPYVLQNTSGKIYIKNNFDMGYCTFGPVILTFLLWLVNRKRTEKVKKIVFMSRDGYFLKEDFEYLCELIQEPAECCYIGISRQLAMMASIESEQDLIEYISMPYTGSIAELFEDRFFIKDIEEIPGKPLEEYIRLYSLEIKKEVRKIRQDYLSYLEQFSLGQDCAVVDIGYYGNNQRYLNKLLKTGMQGYYFNANLSEKNKNIKTQKMTVCFQKENDITGQNSQILKKQIYLESFLTAPYGMVKAVDKSGGFKCAPRKRNQEYFQEKIEVNRGVKQFITDYIEKFGEYNILPDIDFIDRYYGCCFSGGLEFSSDVKISFYNDNAMMNRIESMLFY